MGFLFKIVFIVMVGMGVLLAYLMLMGWLGLVYDGYTEEKD
jgi:hypothetical protein